MLSDAELRSLLEKLDEREKEHLAKHDYVWRPDLGLLWRDPEGRWRREKFTHGTYFRTREGEFHIRSGGHVRRVEPLAAGTPDAGRRAWVTTSD